MTDSTETDIDALIERLDSHMGQQDVPVLLRDCRLARDALRQLRAERDAAARDMRERCAKVAEDYDGDGMEGRGYDAQLGDASLTCRDIAEQIRALPCALIATSRATPSEGQS
jgi:hypothetical protein